jgi:predicted ATPase/DNA-binding CsgD family transcriptional regulator
MSCSLSNMAEKASAAPEERTPASHRSGLVGRDELIAKVIADLTAVPLVTLDGVGGVGKSALALEVGQTLEASIPVAVVELRPHRGPGLVAAAIATTLGLHDHHEQSILPTLLGHLRAKRMLLILDNCEHLVQEVADVATAILDNAPDIQILTTSREALRVDRERIRRVPPLSLPPASPTKRWASVGDMPYDSVRLLVARAVDNDLTDFAKTADPELVALLVRRLGGIPLAISLAAGRLRGMGLHDILNSPRGLLPVLNRNGRGVDAAHQTLWDCIAWSDALCTPASRKLWMRLSLFADDVDLPTMVAVCADDDTSGVIDGEAVEDLADALVWASVLTRSDSAGDPGQARYRLLDPIREYGLSQLRATEPDAGNGWHLRHARHFCRVAAAVAAQRFSPLDAQVVTTIRRHMPDMRAALSWCLNQPDHPELTLKLTSALCRATAFFTSGSVGEGQRAIEAALRLPGAVPNMDRMIVVTYGAWHAVLQGSPVACEWVARCRRHAAETASHDPSQATLASALADYAEGIYLMFSLASVDCIEVLKRAVAAFRSGEMPTFFHLSSLYLAQAGIKFDELEIADIASRDCLCHAEALAASHSLSWARWGRGLVDIKLGRIEEARALFESALRAQRELGAYWGTEFMVETLARCAAAAGEFSRAAQLLGAAVKLRSVAGSDGSGLASFTEPRADVDELLRTKLDADRYQVNYRAGVLLSYEEAVSLALGENSAIPLTDRQLEVAQLVSEGLTNEGIARRLDIGLATVHTHVRDTMKRLDVRNRAGIAAWFSARANVQL